MNKKKVRWLLSFIDWPYYEWPLLTIR